MLEMGFEAILPVLGSLYVYVYVHGAISDLRQGVRIIDGGRTLPVYASVEIWSRSWAALASTRGRLLVIEASVTTANTSGWWLWPVAALCHYRIVGVGLHVTYELQYVTVHSGMNDYDVQCTRIDFYSTWLIYLEITLS